MSEYIVDNSQANLIKMWTKGIDLEEGAIKQLRNIANMPFIHKHVAVMPDCHVGKGATIGTVIATKGAIIPAAVGVDIGCGMMAVKTSLHANELPDNLHLLRSLIEQKVPHGRTNNGQEGDRGAWGSVSENIYFKGWKPIQKQYEEIIERHPKIKHNRDLNTFCHLGTLGTGNHFIEVCLDEVDNVWVMCHSGSRGVGNKIGSYFIEKAKEEMLKYYINLPDSDLSYLVQDTQIFNDYLKALSFAQSFAATNRKLIMEATIEALSLFMGHPIEITDEVVSCHHNYVATERHFNSNVFITRKGAVNAAEGILGIIPGSMGAKSFIVKGKGNHESFCSCSHGAGRKLSRNVANRSISLKDHELAMHGIEARLDKDVLDESPACYKNIEVVMKAQDSLVDIVHTLRQIVNVKG